MPNALHALPLRPVKHPGDRVEPLVEVLERRAEGDAHEVVAGRVEEVAPVRGVDVEEDAGDDDGLFFEELFEEGLTCRMSVRGMRGYSIVSNIERG